MSSIYSLNISDGLIYKYINVYITVFIYITMNFILGIYYLPMVSSAIQMHGTEMVKNS